MAKDKQTEFFEFLEIKKDELYKLVNQNSKLKTTKAKLELLDEIYKFWGFNFLRVAYLRENEKNKWRYYYCLLKKEGEKESETEKSVLKKILLIFKRLKKYDIIKIRKSSYVLNNNQ